MRFSKILLSGFIVTILAACDESDTIGSSVIEDEIEVIMDSTYTVTGNSIENSRVQSRTVTQLLGILDAKGYGSLKSDFITQLMPAGTIDTSYVTANDIDSIKLRLFISLGGYTGDSIVPMGLNVYRITNTDKQIPSPIYSDFNPQEYYSAQDLELLTETPKIYTANALGESDSIAELSYRFIDIKLPLSLGQEIFNKYKENPEIFAIPSEFAKWFPGLYVSNAFGSGRVINISSSEVKFYYHKTVELEDTGTDTTYYKEGNYFAVTPEIVTNNNISFSISSDLKNKADAGEALIVAPTGYDVELKFPTQEIIDDYRNNAGNISVVNALSFEIPAEEIANIYGINPPPYLLLIKSSEKDKFFADSDITDDTSSFYAAYNSTNNTYAFSDMRKYIIEMLKKEEITDDDVTFTLTPISISTESNSSSYYYYSTTTYINNITPYIASPAMVKLNLDKAKIKFTYSKQTIK